MTKIKVALYFSVFSPFAVKSVFFYSLNLGLFG